MRLITILWFLLMLKISYRTLLSNCCISWPFILFPQALWNASGIKIYEHRFFGSNFRNLKNIALLSTLSVIESIYKIMDLANSCEVRLDLSWSREGQCSKQRTRSTVYGKLCHDSCLYLHFWNNLCFLSVLFHPYFSRQCWQAKHGNFYPSRELLFSLFTIWLFMLW